DIDHITHVRIVDVIGDLGSHGTTDTAGNKINDPYPTEIPSGGFDLDAVAALSIAGWWPAGIDDVATNYRIYPNPATYVLHIDGKVQLKNIAVTTVTGVAVIQSDINSQHAKVDIGHLTPGIYYLILNDANGNQWVERFTKY
ncbi:MAG: T9SS type A sorting domain-containing protein, partial [Chitinophagaceae bacterium]|nr:T9SS type A sorting domain-containing protein [Chitinophagaceae bacterium]